MPRSTRQLCWFVLCFAQERRNLAEKNRMRGFFVAWMMVVWLWVPILVMACHAMFTPTTSKSTKPKYVCMYDWNQVQVESSIWTTEGFHQFGQSFTFNIDHPKFHGSPV